MNTKPAFVSRTKPSCDVTFTHEDGETESFTRGSWEAVQNLVLSYASELTGRYPISYGHALGLLQDRGYTVTCDGEVLE